MTGDGSTIDRRDRSRHLFIWLAVLLVALGVCLPLAACSESTTPAEDSSTSLGEEQASSSSQPDDDNASDTEAPSLSNLTAHFIDVGQGDSELLELPDGKWMLVDAGDADHGKDVVSYLQANGVDHIDYLVATHPHADHIGGMADVVAAFDVGELWMPNAATDTQTFNDFLDAVEAKGIPVKQARSGETIVPASSGYEVAVLGPAEDVSSTDMNDYSAVIKVTYGDTSLLLTGDASAQEIVADSPGHVDVLKAAHHGSETGTTTAVLDATTPDYVVMSYEEGNSYGHPDQSVLDAIGASGAKAYSTAANGNVTATSDGSTFSIATSKDGTIAAGVSAAERQRQEEAAQAKARAEAEEKARQEAAAKAQAEAEAEAEAAAAQAEAERQQQEAEAAAAAQQQAETVYVTRTGEKYHRAGCQYLKKSSTPISLQDAISQGYTPCSKCF